MEARLIHIKSLQPKAVYFHLVFGFGSLICVIKHVISLLSQTELALVNTLVLCTSLLVCALEGLQIRLTIFVARIVQYDFVRRFKVDFRQQFEQIFCQLFRIQWQKYCAVTGLAEERQTACLSVPIPYHVSLMSPIIQTNRGNLVDSGDNCAPFSSTARKQRSKPGITEITDNGPVFVPAWLGGHCQHKISP